MLTNPNTCGLFERDIAKIAELVHDAGAYFYCDGANFNAIAGLARPGDLGVDAMHINLHKTFSTPHGGGGPGAGPVVLSARLAPFAPVPLLIREDGGLRLKEDAEGTRELRPHDRLSRPDGHVRARARLHAGAWRDGWPGVARRGALGQLYARVAARHDDRALWRRPCMHEALFDDAWLEGTGVTTLDFAKAMIDEGYHPMTMYFPLVVHGAMLIEPTKSEVEGLARSVHRDAAAPGERALQGDEAAFHAAPLHAPRRRLDETLAARKPVLRRTQGAA